MNEPTDTGTHRRALGNGRRVVVKLGSRLVTESPAARPAAIADEIARMRAARGLEIVVVSSGAIAMGMRVLRLRDRPDDLPTLQAAAAVGQGRLLQNWEHSFAAHELTCGQVLLTHDDIADRQRFLNARHTLMALLSLDVVPIINENDTVAVEEIKYGDNDMLAALVCNLISADALIMLTDVEGLRDEAGARIPLVRDINAEAAPLAGATTGDGVGSGGMASKVQAARVATRSGVAAVVGPGREPGVLARILGGDDVGTLFVPPAERISSRKHWIAYGSRPCGRLVVDDGAWRALVEKGRSLLPAGIVAVEGQFGIGEPISLVNSRGTEFGRGLAGYCSDDVRRLKGVHSADIEHTLGYKYLDEVIHRDDLVLL